MVLAPEHPLVDKLTTPEQHEAVHEYIHEAVRQTDIEREALDKEKTGVFTGSFAINPVNGESSSRASLARFCGPDRIT